MPSAAEAEEKHSPDTTLFAVQRLGERKDLGEIIKLGLIFSSLAICVPICVESDDTLKKGWQSQDQHKNWSQHQTRNPGSLHPKSQFHPIPHVARDAITCSPTGARTSQTGDVLCRGGVTAGTASDLLCTASMAKGSRGWRGHRERRLGRSSRQSHCLVLSKIQPGNPHPRYGHHSRKEKPAGPGQAGTCSPSHHMAAQRGSWSCLLEMLQGGTGRDKSLQGLVLNWRVPC